MHIGLVVLSSAVCLVGPQGPVEGRIQAIAGQSRTAQPAAGPYNVEVSIGVFLIDFARISPREETFDIEAYVQTTWSDPALALRGGATSPEVRSFRRGDFWMPALEFLNSVDQVKVHPEELLRVDARGRVSHLSRISGKFSTPLDLVRFPFDHQVLSIGILPLDRDGRGVKLVADHERIGRSRYAFLSDWDILGVSSEVDPLQNRAGLPQSPFLSRYAAGNRLSAAPLSLFIFEIKIARRSTYYFWRVLFPLTMLVVACSVVFWFEPTNLQPLISTVLGILLSLVTFNFSIDFALPKVPNLTFIDRYVLSSFSFVLLAIVAVATIHVTLNRQGIERALRLQKRARILYLGGYALWVVAISVYSLI